jgi:low temperature requirement protein LtrA
MVGHLPLTLSIAAAGAAMVSVIEHATASRAPVAATWLLTGSTALGLVSLAVIVGTLQDYGRLKTVYRPTLLAMLGAASLAILVGAWRPAPLMLVVALAAIQLLVWIFAIFRQLRIAEAAAQPD